MRKTQREKQTRNSRTEKHEEYGSEIQHERKKQNNKTQKERR